MILILSAEIEEEQKIVEFHKKMIEKMENGKRHFDRLNDVKTKD